VAKIQPGSEEQNYRTMNGLRRNRSSIKAQKPVPKSLFFIRKQAQPLLVIFA